MIERCSHFFHARSAIPDGDRESRAELFAVAIAPRNYCSYGGAAEQRQGGHRGCRTLRGPIGYLRLINTAR